MNDHNLASKDDEVSVCLCLRKNTRGIGVDVYSVNYTCDAHVPDNILSGIIVFFSKVYFDPIIAIPPPLCIQWPSYYCISNNGMVPAAGLLTADWWGSDQLK